MPLDITQNSDIDNTCQVDSPHIAVYGPKIIMRHPYSEDIQRYLADKKWTISRDSVGNYHAMKALYSITEGNA